MRKGEFRSRHGESGLLLIFLLGASFLLSVPAATDTSPISVTSETITNSTPDPLLSEYIGRDWDFASRESRDSFQLLRGTSRDQIDVPELDSWQVLDVMPFGTPHVPIIIDDNSDFDTQGWPGEGTVEQPYLIAGLNINAPTGVSAINITNTDVDFFIKDCWLTSNSTNVIELRSVTHARIANNTIVQGERGVAAFHSEDLIVYDNLFYSFGWAGVYLEDCILSTLSNNNCTSCSIGLHVEQSEQCTVEDNFLAGCTIGIDLYWDCEYITVFNNTIQDSWSGIYLYLNCHDNIIDSNNCTLIGNLAITAIECSANTIVNNFCYLNTASIVLLNCTTHTIAGNDCGLGSGGFEGGLISLRNTNYSLVSNNHLENTFILIEITNGSTQNEISNNNLSFYEAGILLWNSAPYNAITNNTCNAQGIGQVDILIEDLSHNCTVTENRCNQSEVNIGVLESDYTNVTDNVCYESSEASIVVMGSYYVLVKDNTLGNGTTGIVMDNVAFSSVLTNTISNFTGSWSGLTGIHLNEFYNSSVEGNYVTECNVAIFMESSEYSNITDNTCVENIDGIIAVATNYDIIIENNICHLQEGYAIAVVESFSCSVVRNTCTNTSGFEGVCLLLGDADVDVSWNSFSLSTGGMDVQGNDGLITHNTIEDNELFGMTVSGIIGPIVTWNVFEDNGVNAFDSSSTAMFDYNYWSNYTGVDSNADGIGDTVHPIDGPANNNDTHPIVYHSTLPVWSSEPVDQTAELGGDFYYFLVVTTSSDLAPIVDWWVNDTTNFAVYDGSVENAIFLDLGEYPLEVKAINLYGFELSATFTVTVLDRTDPEINGPNSIGYIVGQVGRTITWIPEDYDPASYSVTLDGVEVMSGAWNSTTENVTISVDGLSVGDHFFVATFTDGSGNSANHEVIVSVNEDSTPLILAIGAGCTAIAVLVVIYLVRKKKPTE